MPIFDRAQELARQRRNVLLTSTAVMLYYLGNADISSFLGNQIRDTTVILPAMWLALAIFTWRYWVHARGWHSEERIQVLAATDKKVRDRVADVVWPILETKHNNKFDAATRQKYSLKFECDVWGYSTWTDIAPNLKVRVPLFKTGLEFHVMRQMINKSLSARILRFGFHTSLFF